MGVDFSDSACAEDCCIDHVIISSLVGMLPLIWVNPPESTALFVGFIAVIPARPSFLNTVKLMTPSICLDPLYPNLLTEDKIPRVAAAGFRHVEFWGWRDKDIPAIEAACRKDDVRVVNFSGHRVGSPVADTTHPILFADASDAVATARILSCQRLMLLTNALNPDGSVADRFEEIPDDIKFKNTVSALNQLISIIPDDITLVLEPLNTLVDHAGYYLNDIDTASAIVRAVGSPRLKILCDLYHFSVMVLISKRLSRIIFPRLVISISRMLPADMSPGPARSIGLRCCVLSGIEVTPVASDSSIFQQATPTHRWPRSTNCGKRTSRCVAEKAVRRRLEYSSRARKNAELSEN
jgi:hydroxypyruvate isomerase